MLQIIPLTKKARVLAKITWSVSNNWDNLTLNTIGKQLIRAADSVSANLSEGWNRYSKKDKVSFFIIARASVTETKDWVEKASERELINDSDYKDLQEILSELPKEINGLIKGTNQNLKK